MFTGIVEEVGTVEKISHSSQSCTLAIRCKKVLEGTAQGDSIAVNGACLTVTQLTDTSFCCDVTPETMRRTAFSLFKAGTPVNLERALRLCDRLGGHIVLGHVDAAGKILSVTREGNARNISIAADPRGTKYILEKGSVTVDGVSLTVAGKKGGTFTVSLIPHTGKTTVLLSKKSGDPVNLEYDYLGKYVEQFVKEKTEKGLTIEKLKSLHVGGNYGV